MFVELKELDPDFKAQIEIIRHVEGMKTDANSLFVKKFRSTVGIDETISVGFTIDGAHLKDLNAPIVIFGPGQSGLCHKPNEYIELADVEKARQCYKKIIIEFLT
jgi:acetylornithine deacetylase/succinyl-diaminopimelate desuccinylase-like protein